MAVVEIQTNNQPSQFNHKRITSPVLRIQIRSDDNLLLKDYTPQRIIDLYAQICRTLQKDIPALIESETGTHLSTLESTDSQDCNLCRSYKPTEKLYSLGKFFANIGSEENPIPAPNAAKTTQKSSVCQECLREILSKIEIIINENPSLIISNEID